MFRLPLSQMGLWERARDILSAHSQDSASQMEGEVTGHPGGARSLPMESSSCTASFSGPWPSPEEPKAHPPEESAEPVNPGILAD